jgi:fibronectin-binding autotransporter adhesin
MDEANNVLTMARNGRYFRFMKLTTIHNSILQITSVFSLSGALCLNAIAGSEVWTGAAGDNNWNTAGNWTGDNTPPAAGDIIAFGAQGAGSLMLNNNMTVDTSFAGLYFNATAPAFILTGNEITQTGATIDNSLNLETINLPITSTAAHSYGVAAGNTMLVGGVISGSGGGITKIMGGTLTLTNNNAYTGGTTINAGTLIVDYTGGAANNIVPSGSALTLGGGAIQIKGNSVTSISQTVNGATVNPGLNVISVSNNAATFNLGAFTQTLGSQTEFIGPAYDSNPTGGSATLVPATGTITTTTAGLQNNLLWPGSRVAVATVGLYEWASSVTTAGTRNVLAGSQQTGTFYAQVAAGTTTLAAADLNYDLLGNATANAGTALWYADTIRFNVPGAFTFTSNGGGTGHACLIGGILVTPNVGANNTTIASGGAWLCGPNASAGASAIDVYQNNTAGELLMNIPLYYYSSTARAASYVQAGAGTVVLSGSGTSSGNTGAPYLNGGSTVISANQQLGATATAATLNLNGGTLVAGANVSLDNGSGANKRPVALGSNGGGLAALGTGGPFTLTVSGVISGATGTGPLTIGIPASSANGNVVGQLPGTGAGTANTTATNATGTVILTANETYTGNTVISSGSLQLGAAATISNSASITVGSGATFDVSQVTGGFTLGPTVSQNLMGSGTVTGAVSVASGSGIYGGTDGTYGTNTFINNLTLSSGAAAYFDLGTSATGSNDEIVVQGTLTLNGNVHPCQGSGHISATGSGQLFAFQQCQRDCGQYRPLTGLGCCAGELGKIYARGFGQQRGLAICVGRGPLNHFDNSQSEPGISQRNGID